MPMRTDSAKTIYLKDYRPPDYLVDRVELSFELDDEVTRVTSSLKIRRNPASESVDPPLKLDGEGLRLVELSLDGSPLTTDAYEYDGTCLTIESVPAQFTLTSRVEIRPQENTALEGLYRSNKLYCTQCEAEGFRRITFFPDRPDLMSVFTTRITADKGDYPVLLSNGNCIEERDLPDGRHQVVWQDPFPKPCYLFALVAGDLRFQQDSYTTQSDREVDLRIYVEPENIDKCDHAMRSLKHSMAWDEEHYGREYDLDIFMIVAVNDFNMGAMENKGLNIFNSKFVLARPDTATDRDFQGIEGVIAHEYFHNWTGNRITCRDWFQLSLKEGLTVFRDQEFSADMGSRGVKRIEDVRLLRSHQFAEDAGPMAHPVRPDSYMEINNFYTVTVYEKGAEVVRMQANLLGPETYRKATDLYFERHDGQAVTTEDFVQCMADASGRDLSQFKRWYDQAGTPEIRVTAEYDDSTNSYHLDFEQSCPATPGQAEKLPYHIPVAVALLDVWGKPLPMQLAGEAEVGPAQRVLELNQEKQRFTFMGVESEPVPSLLRGFSAPVKLEFAYSDKDLMFLMAKDSDDFNRWDAAHTLSQRTLLKLVDDIQNDRPLGVDEGYIDAFSKALNDQQADKALLTEVLSLPSESTIGDQMSVVDVDAIHQAREWLKHELSTRLRQELVDTYSMNCIGGDYDVAHASMARRSLKNLSLHLLMQLEEPDIYELCMNQYQTANNMTDVMAALSALSNSQAPQREQALADFESKWQDDPLVMDKWFAVQAMAKLPGTLDQVKTLMDHPAFSIRNPNKVRSLVGAFCSGNLINFHAADGSGYEFLIDNVLTLDSLNPQIAARMLRIMSRWRRYDESRQALMKAQFERVLAKTDVSKDVFEIASKSLAD
jgi:aminopeptidase N